MHSLVYTYCPDGLAKKVHLLHSSNEKDVSDVVQIQVHIRFISMFRKQGAPDKGINIIIMYYHCYKQYLDSAVSSVASK